jgi:glucose dehydrogenase
MAGTPYGARITGLMSPLNAPCNKPPYGKLSAVDMRTNKLLWSRPIGSARDTGPFGMASHLPIPMGMPMFSGSMVTRSGLMFIGATQDRTFRAFDTTSGRLLWSTRLPGGAQANPMSYVSPKTGRQYVVVSAGGHVMLRSPMSDAVVAFALPKK